MRSVFFVNNGISFILCHFLADLCLMLNLFVLIEAYDTLKQFRRSLCDCNSVVFTINPDLRNP